MTAGAILVLDIGKTFAKLSLWGPDGTLRAQASRPNPKRTSGRGYASLDASGIAAWLGESIATLPDPADIAAIVPVGHGAAACLVDADGLALEPMDYEAEPPPAVMAAYRGMRDPFALTGSPALPLGLNLGAQLHWLQTIAPDVFARSRILPWPQYWAWLLSSVAASEVSSLGCHSDLWLPREGRPSPLAVERGWAERFAPLRRAADVLGVVSAAWRAKGLSPDCRVLCGMHDSNAALLAARGHRELSGGECTVISTGTWFVMMRRPDPGARLDLAALDEARDGLINVDVEGVAVPSARFMGGREAEIIEAAATPLDIAGQEIPLIAAARSLVERSIMALPGFVSGVGAFPNAPGRFLGEPDGALERRAAAGLYLALMADVSLGLIGSTGALVIEGRFAADPVFTGMLAALRPAQGLYLSHAHDSVAYGALRLVDPKLPPHGALRRPAPLPFDVAAYAARWRAETASVAPA